MTVQFWSCSGAFRRLLDKLTELCREELGGADVGVLVSQGLPLSEEDARWLLSRPEEVPKELLPKMVQAGTRDEAMELMRSHQESQLHSKE